MTSKLAAFEQMGGRESLIAINKVFYDKVYDHPWLRLYFEKIPQEHIEIQQVDFMQKVLGGENLYVGKTPPLAHMHMYITEDLMAVRQTLLKEAFKETDAHPELAKKWLNLDESFKRLLIKSKPEQCKGRFKTDPILNFDNPK